MNNGYTIVAPERVTELVNAMLARPNFSAPVKISRPDIFNPTNLSEYIGQAEAKAMATIMIKAANKENRLLPNIMIVGGYGLGKTTLAKLILQSVCNAVTVLDGASVTIDKLPSTGTVIVDEIHNMKVEVQDSLNILIDSGVVSVIGCTTSPGLLSAPFKSRFRNIYLEDYTVDDLTAILTHICARKHVSVERGILVRVAERCRRNARAATNNIGFIFDYMVSSGTNLNQATIEAAFAMLGIDKKGYLKRDYQYVSALRNDRPVGLQYLASRTNIDAKTIEEEVEPFLLQNGIIDRTPKGRVKLQEI